jgi:hypothetical protein
VATVVVYHFIPEGETAVAKNSLSKSGQSKILIVYFSHSGNTRHMAGQIHERIGGDILEIRTVNIYSEDYDTVVEQAKQEQNRNARPKLSTQLPDLSVYDTIFVGYPNWFRSHVFLRDWPSGAGVSEINQPAGKSRSGWRI